MDNTSCFKICIGNWELLQVGYTLKNLKGHIL